MDLIDKEAALDAHCTIVCGHKHDAICLMECPDYEVFNHLPSAQPERKKGKWIYCTTSGHWKCSCCKSKAPWSCEDDISVWHKSMLEWKSSYCPCCGADMRGEQDG